MIEALIVTFIFAFEMAKIQICMITSPFTCRFLLPYFRNSGFGLKEWGEISQWVVLGLFLTFLREISST